MPYVYLWMPIGWNGLGMCLPLGGVYFKARGVKKDSIPDMIKVKLTYFPIKSWIVYPDVDTFCKPTHIDQYLQWDNHYNLSAKYSVIGTLIHRVKIVCTGPDLFNEELQHLREALVKCKYPRWPI